jgi:hypothetical protein
MGTNRLPNDEFAALSVLCGLDPWKNISKWYVMVT